MKHRVITAPTTLPVTLDEAKAHLRVLHSDEDADITIKLKAAIEKAEQRTSRQLGTATVEAYLDALQTAVKLPKTPLQSLTKVEYIDVNGATKTWDDWYVDDKAEPAVIYFDTFPTDINIDGVNNVTITYQCGHSETPDAIKSWVLLYTASLYEHREGIVEGTVVSDKKAQYFDHLLDSYRIIPL